MPFIFTYIVSAVKYGSIGFSETECCWSIIVIEWDQNHSLSPGNDSECENYLCHENENKVFVIVYAKKLISHCFFLIINLRVN